MPAEIAILLGVFQAIETGMARLWNELIHDAIQFLSGIEMIVAMKDRRHAVLHEQRMDRRLPTGAFGLELILAVLALAAPLVKFRGFTAAARRFVQAADEVMDEDELELRLTGF